MIKAKFLKTLLYGKLQEVKPNTNSSFGWIEQATKSMSEEQMNEFIRKYELEKSIVRYPTPAFLLKDWTLKD